MEFEDLLALLKVIAEKENINYNDFAICGSGPMAVRGIRGPGDLDIIIRKEVFENLKEREYKVSSDGILRIGNLEISDKWNPLDYDTNLLIDNADVIDGIKYVKLDYILEWKKKVGREKDKVDIELIMKYQEKYN